MELIKQNINFKLRGYLYKKGDYYISRYYHNQVMFMETKFYKSTIRVFGQTPEQHFDDVYYAWLDEIHEGTLYYV